jgi:hypothetical protein
MPFGTVVSKICLHAVSEAEISVLYLINAGKNLLLRGFSGLAVDGILSSSGLGRYLKSPPRT